MAVAKPLIDALRGVGGYVRDTGRQLGDLLSGGGVAVHKRWLPGPGITVRPVGAGRGRPVSTQTPPWYPGQGVSTVGSGKPPPPPVATGRGGGNETVPPSTDVPPIFKPVIPATSGGREDVEGEWIPAGEDEEPIIWGPGWPEAWKNKKKRDFPDVDVQQGDDMAADWGEFFQGVLGRGVDAWLGSQTGRKDSFASWPTGPVPTEVVVNTQTGEVKKCPRRRRRRLLTPTDLSDLAALAALVGKGSTSMNLAVAKAVRR